jgi:hypothetical protein
MPGYDASPFPPNPPCLVTGQPGYAFGSFAEHLPTTRMQVTTTARAASVATVGVKVIEGNIPSVGSLITITGTSQAGGAFNVTNAALTGVTIDAVLGTGTVTFAIGAGTTAQAADIGTALVPTPEVGEALTNTASVQFAVPFPTGVGSQARTITWSTAYPTAPSTVTMALQGSLFDIDAQYQTIDTSTNTGGEERVATLSGYRFLRLKASNVTGALPTCIGKINVS